MASSYSASPLRRKSMHLQNVRSHLSVNDDEAELLARRRVSEVNTTPVSTTHDRRRSSFGLSFLANMPANQMAERVSQCIKLSTENKINTKNAFTLDMIDFMTYMIKKKDSSMTNLQVASTSLDVSAKIYGYRVDGVHTDILKLIGGSDKQDKENTQNAEEIDQGDAENNQDTSQEKKRRKRNKQQILTTVEALRTKVETEKPSIIMMEADSQTTDMLYQTTLPCHANSRFYPHRYNDVLVDTINKRDGPSRDTVSGIPKIKVSPDMEICPPIFNFSFRNWTSDDESDERAEVPPQLEKNNGNTFHFDLDASLPHEDDHVVMTDMNYDVEMTEVENVERFVVRNEIENIVDFQQVISNTAPSKASEYSFVGKNLNLHWAGSSHWKNNILRRGNSNVEHENRHSQRRKRKEAELTFETSKIESANTKFLPGQSIKLNMKSVKSEWNEEMVTLPPDEHYNIMQVDKLYVHPLTCIRSENENVNRDNSLPDDNDYDNDNDMLNHYSDIRGSGNESDCVRPESNGTTVVSQAPLTGDNLVAIPKLTKKLAIVYAARAKKVDMRQLKQSIWTCLEKNTTVQEPGSSAQDTSKKMDGAKRFTDVYNELPNHLSKSNIETLSFPIAFVSLLHLANEKTLKISSSPDRAELIVEQD